MRKQILFYCPSQEILAQEVLDLNFHVIKGAINWNHFDDGFPDLQVLVPERLYDNDVLFLADFSDATEIFRQLAVIYALPSFGINSLKVFLPFFSTGTMDRVTEEGQIVTAKTLARMLSVIPAAACPTQIIILDIHALQEQFYFSDQVRIKCISGIPFFLDKLKRDEENLRSIAIAFPDEGAYKRFGRYFAGFDKIICEKRRLGGEKRKVTIKEGDPRGKKVIIVDDLIMLGGTLLECAEVLKAAGAKSVEAYATHGVFPKKNWQKFFEAEVKLYLTNSLPKKIQEIYADKPSSSQVEVLSLARMILQEIYLNS